MVRDPEAKETFKKPPMVAYRQTPNLQRLLCKAKLPTTKNHEKEEKQDYKGDTNRATYVPMYSIPKKFAQARQRKNLR